VLLSSEDVLDIGAHAGPRGIASGDVGVIGLSSGFLPAGRVGTW
jgi:hypothetical protein